MLKKFLILMVIIAIALMPTISFAEDVVGDIKYNSELDITEVIEIKYTRFDKVEYRKFSETSIKHEGELDKNIVLYVTDTFETIEQGEKIEWVEAHFDNTGTFYFQKEHTTYISEEESEYTPVIMTKNTDYSTSQYKITYYCSACNSPAGTGVTASGTNAYIGSAASNDFPLGTIIYVEGYGNYTILDRMGSSGIIDIFTGYSDVCYCSGVNYANVEVVK